MVIDIIKALFIGMCCFVLLLFFAESFYNIGCWVIEKIDKYFWVD